MRLSSKTNESIRQALEQSWSIKTSVCFNPTIAPRSYGQCAPTAAVLQEQYGGEILRTEVKKLDGGSIRHFYNRIGGERIDFTADQFNIQNYWSELEYADIPSSLEEAYTEMLPCQLASMRHAFCNAINTSDT